MYKYDIVRMYGILCGCGCNCVCVPRCLPRLLPLLVHIVNGCMQSGAHSYSMHYSLFCTSSLYIIHYIYYNSAVS